MEFDSFLRLASGIAFVFICVVYPILSRNENHKSVPTIKLWPSMLLLGGALFVFLVCLFYSMAVKIASKMDSMEIIKYSALMLGIHGVLYWLPVMWQERFLTRRNYLLAGLLAMLPALATVFIGLTFVGYFLKEIFELSDELMDYAILPVLVCGMVLLLIFYSRSIWLFFAGKRIFFFDWREKTVISCEICSQRLRIPVLRGKILEVRCPQGHVFTYPSKSDGITPDRESTN